MKRSPFFSRSGFTLIELLTVIAIIAVLMGLLFPAVAGVKETAKKAQARNDITQIVNGVKSYNTDYSKYPCASSNGGNGEDYFADDENNNILFDILRVADKTNGNVSEYNPRMVTYMEIPAAKNSSQPKSGIGGNGRFYDPWGYCYRIRIDSNYDNAVENPYQSNAGFSPISTGVIAWSIGKDGGGATDKTGGGDKNAGTSADDIISWQ